jgi:hypothetical protein
VAVSDFTLIPVSTRPTQVCPPLGKGATVTLYNQDIVNIVYVSKQQWFTPGSGAGAPIQPLTSAVLPADTALYAAALVSGVQPLAILPEGGTLSPSPAQIAQQINAIGLMKDTTGQTINGTLGVPAQDPTLVGQNTAIPDNISNTGVPLLGRSDILINSSGLTIPTGSTNNYGTFTLSKISYEAFVSYIEVGAGGTALKTMTINLKFTDSTTGQIVDQVNFDVCPATPGGSAHQVIITGQTAGDTVTVTVKNNDSVNVISTMLLLECGRIFPHDHMFKSLNFPTFTGVSGASTDVCGGLIIDTSPNINANSTIQRIMGCYNGLVLLHGAAVSVTTSAVFTVNATDPVATNDGTVWGKVMSPPPTQDSWQLSLPKSQCALNLKNNDGSARVVACTVTTQDK